MSPLEFLSQPTSLRISSTLLHFVWQGFAVAALVWLVLRYWSPRDARRRYAISLAGLAFMVACPVTTFFVLDSGAPLSAPAEAANSSDPVEKEESRLASRGISPVEQEAESAISHNLSSAVDWNSLFSQRGYLVLVWLGGVVLLSGRLLLGYAGVHWLRLGGRAVDDDWQTRFDRLAKRLGLSRARVRISTRVSEALVVGFWRPLVLLPAAWLVELPADSLEAIVAHELAHLRRHDLWINLLQRVVETLLFYHPAVWWLSSRVRQERELCCDELAVSVTGRRVEYVTALELVARKRLVSPRPLLAAPIGGENAMTLLNRVRNVLGLSPQPDRARIWPAGLLLLAAPVALWAVSFGLSMGPPNAVADEDQVAQKDGERGEAERKEAAERREAELKAAAQRDANRRDAERKEGERREGDRPDVRRVEERREGDRPAERRVEERRVIERPDAPREGAGRDEALIRLIQQLREEVATLRAEVRELRARTGGEVRRDGDRPREGEVRRDGDRPREGEVRRDGDRPRPDAPRREGDRPREGERDGDRPREGDRPRDGDRPKAGPRDGDRPKEGPRDGDRPKEGPRDGDRPKDGPRDGDREKPKATGVVRAVQEDGRLVELAIDGEVKAGQVLAIVRGDKYVGRVITIKVTGERAVGEASPAGKELKVQVGDAVISNLEEREARRD